MPAPRTGALLGSGFMSMALLLGACASDPPATDTPYAATSVEAVYGIRVESLHLSAAGSMLDFRYRVIDPDKAAPMLNGKIQPYLLDELRGARLGVPDTPKLGRIRQTARNNHIATDRSYFVMFGNPGKAVQSGDRLTLLLGSVKITELHVQ